MDETDIEIAKIMMNNARISFRKIAAKLGISTKKVIKRYEKMRKDFLPHATITLDLEKLGFVSQVIFLIKISYENELNEVFQKIIQIPNIIVAIKSFGAFEISAIAPLENFEQLYKLNEEISNINGIEKIEILFEKPFNKCFFT
ncbi:MAG: Lrp/AsnC family transcriptional regulator [Candidatus Bathyarchaeota archaeon]